jgi:predicted Fe-Mo cluster-binding NifX family protein
VRIAIAVEKAGVDSLCSPIFGRCPYFVIIDEESGEETTLPNPAQSDTGGAGTHAAQVMVNERIDVVIAGRVGAKARRALDAAGIDIREPTGDTARAALAGLRAGQHGSP